MIHSKMLNAGTVQLLCPLAVSRCVRPCLYVINLILSLRGQTSDPKIKPSLSALKVPQRFPNDATTVKYSYISTRRFPYIDRRHLARCDEQEPDGMCPRVDLLRVEVL